MVSVFLAWPRARTVIKTHGVFLGIHSSILLHLTGLAFTLSGFIGLALTPMDILTQTTFKGNYNPINIFLIVAGAITNLAVAIKVWMYVKKGRVALD